MVSATLLVTEGTLPDFAPEASFIVQYPTGLVVWSEGGAPPPLLPDPALGHRDVEYPLGGGGDPVGDGVVDLG